MLTKDQMAKLLNRSLTSAEDTNFTLYLKIATERLQDLLCMQVCNDEGERTYESRYGYRAVYTDPFTSINSVTVDGTEVAEDKYTVMQNGHSNGSWYNVIQFDDKQTGKNIVVDADWGFGTVPSDLQLLLAKLFAQNSVEQTADNTVKSKKIEDFTVTYRDAATYDEFVTVNQSVISKYRQCDTEQIRHGAVSTFFYY